jgi:hypothetical protein
VSDNGRKFVTEIGLARRLNVGREWIRFRCARGEFVGAWFDRVLWLWCIPQPVRVRGSDASH